MRDYRARRVTVAAGGDTYETVCHFERFDWVGLAVRVLSHPVTIVAVILLLNWVGVELYGWGGIVID
jgi:hypothetical protein